MEGADFIADDETAVFKHLIVIMEKSSDSYGHTGS